MSSIVFTWTIDNFLDKTDERIFSPHFTIPEHKQIDWRLKLCPRGDCQIYPDSSDFVSVYLCIMTDEFEAEVDLDLVMVGTDSQVVSMTLKNAFKSKNQAWGYSKFVPRSRLVNNFLVDSNLTIQVKMRIDQFVRVVDMKNCLNATVFVWDINDFASRSQNQLTSDKFTIPGHPLIKWQLVCSPRGISSKEISLQKCTDECEVEIEFKMMILGKRNVTINKSNFKDQNNDWNWVVPYHGLINDYLIHGTLSLQFKVFRVVKVVYQDHHLNYCLKKEPLDLDNINKHCDFCLKTEGKTFDVHKFVLARESPYFEKLFDSDFKEKEENEVDLSQFQADVIQEVLRFVYTGQLHNFDDLSEKLIIAADYFQLDYLKILCQENMTFHISIDNCLEFLKIADQVNASSLKKTAIRFLRKNKNHVNEQTLVKFFEEHVKLGVELLLLIG